MPGLVGLITRMPREHAVPELLRMVETLRHEPFYDTGTWIDASMGVYVGWTARKTSLAEAPLVRSEGGDVVLALSGEDFSDHSAAGSGAGAEPSFPARLNGRFHGLVADRRRGTVLLFTDRYGMHRLYYHATPEAFYFAAEAKALLEVRPELRRADPRSLGELVACGCVLEDRTLFDGIRALPGGAAWVFRQGELERRGSYFEAREWENQAPLAPEAYYRELREVFSTILPRYFTGSEPIAMSLTGGLDTRMIMAWRKPAPGALPCYTFGGMVRECRDVRVARRVARATGQPHAVIVVGEDFLHHFERYAERAVYLADGAVDVSRAPDLYVNELAREIAPVRMTGNYGGEVLRRVRAFKPRVRHPELYHPDFRFHVAAASNTYAEIVQGHPLTFTAFRQAPWHHHGLLALEETQLTLRSPYLDNDFVRTVYRGPASAFTSHELCLRLIADGDAGLRRIRTDRGLGGHTAAGSWLAFLLELEFKMEYAYDYGMPHGLARFDRLLSPLHPERLFLGRHKFYHFRVWYRDALARYVQDVLLDPLTLSRPYLDRGRVEAAVAAHVKGVRNYTWEIHKLLTLELIHRLFLDGAGYSTRRLVTALGAPAAAGGVGGPDAAGGGVCS
jgi:asparagine synthase (glutamine-hydrolysing)